MGMSALFLGCVHEVDHAVIRIEIEQDPARSQDAQPLGIGPARPQERPGQVARQHAVERLVGKIQPAGIHPEERDLTGGSAGQALRLFQHFGADVDANHLMTLACQQHREKAGTRAHVQNTQRPSGQGRGQAGRYFVVPEITLLQINRQKR